MKKIRVRRRAPRYPRRAFAFWDAEHCYYISPVSSEPLWAAGRDGKRSVNIDMGLVDPVDVCSEGNVVRNRIYVADGRTVKVGEHQDDLSFAIVGPEIACEEPVQRVCIDQGAGGCIYALCGTRTIRVHAKDGQRQLLRTLRTPFACGPMWAGPQPNDHLYVSPLRLTPGQKEHDKETQKVAVLSKHDGAVVRTLRTSGWVNGGCVGPDERIYVAYDGEMDDVADQRRGYFRPQLSVGGIDVFLPPLRAKEEC